MSGAANVTSIDAIKQFRTALIQFEMGAKDALTQLLLECRRGVEWIEVDRPRYWRSEERKAHNAVAEARVALDLCQLSVAGDDHRSCYDEQKSLNTAKTRRRFAEQQTQNVNNWQRKIRIEADDFETQLAKINNRFDLDVPRAIAALENMIKALEKYATRGAGDITNVDEEPASDGESS